MARKECKRVRPGAAAQNAAAFRSAHPFARARIHMTGWSATWSVFPIGSVLLARDLCATPVCVFVCFVCVCVYVCHAEHRV